MEAHQLREVDEYKMLAQQAFFNQAVKAVKNKKPMYRKVDDLFNAEEAAHKIEMNYGFGVPTEKELDMQTRAHAAERLAEYRRRKGAVK